MALIFPGGPRYPNSQIRLNWNAIIEPCPDGWIDIEVVSWWRQLLRLNAIFRYKVLFNIDVRGYIIDFLLTI